MPQARHCTGQRRSCAVASWQAVWLTAVLLIVASCQVAWGQAATGSSDPSPASSDEAKAPATDATGAGSSASATVPGNADRSGSGDVRLIIVVGAGGMPEYAEDFQQAAEAWEQLGALRGWSVQRIEGPVEDDAEGQLDADRPADDGLPEKQHDEAVTPKQQLRQAIQSAAQAAELWIVMVGHGTFTNGVARFNLIGPDVSAEELAEWLDNVDQPLVLINTSSASAPFLPAISRPGRVVITATRSGGEFNYARFGIYLAKVIRDASLDLDHDGAISLLEAFLAASRQTEQFYQQEARLATEHALLDDNGDRVGTTADFYRGVRVVKQVESGHQVDGARAKRIILFNGPDAIELPANLAARREELERQLEVVRRQKGSMPEDLYLDRLERIFLQIARLYDQAEQQ